MSAKGRKQEGAQALLEYYKNKGEDKKAEEVEEYLLDLKQTQYELANELYAMAVEFDGLRQRQGAQALLEYYKNKGEDKKAEKVEEYLLDLKETQYELASINSGNILIKDQRSFTRMLDSRARLACKGHLDFSKIKNEGWTPR